MPSNPSTINLRTTLSSKGQIRVPVAVARSVGFKPGIENKHLSHGRWVPSGSSSILTHPPVRRRSPRKRQAESQAMSVREKQLRQADSKSGRLFRVVGPLPKLGSPPRALRSATLDNLALVPGNLLPFKAQYQRIANAPPAGDVLIVLPSTGKPLRQTIQAVVDLVRAKGHGVTTISAARLPG